MASTISDDLRTRRWSITARRSPESWKSSRPSRSATSATWRSPIRRASPRPARRSRPIPREAAELTARANLVAVVSNGTAVLGLGNIGPLAGKPVMEGKAVLFKKFAGIDVFDIEIDAHDGRPRGRAWCRRWSRPSAASTWRTSRRRNASTSRTQLKARMKIPVFHDDQHGTAIIVAAAVQNALHLTGKKIGDGQDRRLRRGRGGARLPQSAGRARREAREHLGHRHRRRGLRGPRRS